VPHPPGGEVPDFIEVFPIILAQPFVADSSVEAFNIGILLGLSWLDILERNAVLLCPRLDRSTDVFRAVIAPNNVGPSTTLKEGLLSARK
jgi:hypothetical protein